MPDLQADRVIDRLMAERQKALDQVAIAQGAAIAGEVEKVEEQAAAVTEKPPARSAIMKIIDEKGKVSVEDLHKLISKEVRRGI